MRLTFLKLRKSRASLEHVVLKYFNYYAIDYLERKRIKGTLFISFACSYKVKIFYMGFIDHREVTRPYLIVGHVLW